MHHCHATAMPGMLRDLMIQGKTHGIPALTTCLPYITMTWESFAPGRDPTWATLTVPAFHVYFTALRRNTALLQDARAQACGLRLRALRDVTITGWDEQGLPTSALRAWRGPAASNIKYDRAAICGRRRACLPLVHAWNTAYWKEYRLLHNIVLALLSMGDLRRLSPAFLYTLNLHTTLHSFLKASHLSSLLRSAATEHLSLKGRAHPRLPAA